MQRAIECCSVSDETRMITFSMKFYEELLGLMPRDIVRMARGEARCEEEEDRS